MEPVGVPRSVTQTELADLVRLLLEIEGWEQRAEGTGAIGACESYASLRIRAGSSSSVVWEDANNIGKNNRLSRVRDAILDAVFETDEGDEPE